MHKFIQLIDNMFHFYQDKFLYLMHQNIYNGELWREIKYFHNFVSFTSWFTQRCKMASQQRKAQSFL
jgi:hypothetical protein